VVTAVPIAPQGPPAGSVYGLNDRLTFFWDAPGEVRDGWRFVVYLEADGGRTPIGVVDTANLGQAYQLRVAPGAIIGEPGEYRWSVVLEDSESGAIIGQSEPRGITLLAE
jgi:hypothetical protein